MKEPSERDEKRNAKNDSSLHPACYGIVVRCKRRGHVTVVPRPLPAEESQPGTYSSPLQPASGADKRGDEMTFGMPGAERMVVSIRTDKSVSPAQSVRPSVLGCEKKKNNFFDDTGPAAVILITLFLYPFWKASWQAPKDWLGLGLLIHSQNPGLAHYSTASNSTKAYHGNANSVDHLSKVTSPVDQSREGHRAWPRRARSTFYNACTESREPDIRPSGTHKRTNAQTHT